MTSEQYKKWVSELPSLSAEQLGNLNSRIKLLFDVSVIEHKGKQEFGMRLMHSLCSTLKKHRVETPSVHTLAKSPAYASAKGKVQDLANFFENISKSKLVQDSILNIGVEQLYFEMIAWKGCTIGSHTILRNVHRIPSCLHKAFPGYSNSGMLVKLVKGRNELTNQ